MSEPFLDREFSDYNEQRIADLERQLAEAKAKAEWTPITDENLPTAEDEVWDDNARETVAADLFLRNTKWSTAAAWLVNRITHRRPLNAPQVEVVPQPK